MANKSKTSSFTSCTAFQSLFPLPESACSHSDVLINQSHARKTLKKNVYLISESCLAYEHQHAAWLTEESLSTDLLQSYILKKYGSATKATPTETSKYMFDMKYGNTNRARPVINGIIACCLLPYTKNPSPMAPNTIPQTSCDAPSIY
jgi:hypothetical protein